MPKFSQLPVVSPALSGDYVALLRGYTGPNTGTDFLVPANSIPGNVIASAIPYTPPFTGGVTTTVGAKLSQYVSAIDFGCDRTAANDSTANMIAAHATGSLIYYPQGTYKCTSAAAAIPIPGGGIIGDGPALTVIVDSSTGANNTFNYTGTSGGVFQNFEVTTGTKTGGYTVNVQPAAGEVFGMSFFRMFLSGMPNGINFVAASGWSVLACNFAGYSGTAIFVNNTNNADSGDSCIQACQFNANNITGIGVYQVASGGLRITGNKFNNGNIGIQLALGAVSTSDLIITGNSFENAHSYNIILTRASGSAVFTNVVITGNQFYISSSTLASFGIWSSQGALFLYTVTITGNVFQIADTGAASAILLDWVTDLIVEGNVVRGSNGSSVGIVIGSHCVDAVVGINAGSLTSQSNQYGSAVNTVPCYLQTGTATATTAIGIGALFYGTVSVTFPTPFSAGYAPRLADCSVAITTAGGGGGLSATIISVSSTALFLQVVGVTNGGSVPIQWSVKSYL